MAARKCLAWAAHHGARAELEAGRVLSMAPEHNIHRTGLGCEVLVDGMAVKAGATSAYGSNSALRRGPPLPEDTLLGADPVVLAGLVWPSSSRLDSRAELATYFSLPSVQHCRMALAVQRMVVHRIRDAAETGLTNRLLGQGSLALDPPWIIPDMAKFLVPAG